HRSVSSRRISSAAFYCRWGTKLGEIVLVRPCSSSSPPPLPASPPEPLGSSSLANRASARSDSSSPCAWTSVREHGRAVALDVFVEAQPKASFGQHASQRGLAPFQRITPQVVAIELDQVEGVEEDAAVRALVTEELERGHAVVVASHRFAIDNA